MLESLEAALKHESSQSISDDKTSGASGAAAPNKSEQVPKNNLDSALDSLDSILNDFPPKEDSTENSSNMSLTASKNQGCQLFIVKRIEKVI